MTEATVIDATVIDATVIEVSSWDEKVMRIAEVVGKVTLNCCHPSLRGATLKLVVPLSAGDLVRDESPTGETLVAWDELGAGPGAYIALSEGPEAAQPFRPEIKAVDAYAAAILDDLNIDESLVKKLYP